MVMVSTALRVPLRSRLLLLAIGWVVVACHDPLAVDGPKLNQQEVSTRSQRGVLYVDDTVFSGTLYGLFPEGQDTAFIRGYRDGKEHGVWKQFFPDGQAQEIRYFRYGKKQGEYRAWWANGQPRLAYHFVDGDYQGTCREWNEQGLLIKEMTYRQGHEEGPQKLWSSSGKIRSNYVVKNGRRYGLLGTKNCTNVTDSLFAN